MFPRIKTRSEDFIMFNAERDWHLIWSVSAGRLCMTVKPAFTGLIRGYRRFFDPLTATALTEAVTFMRSAETACYYPMYFSKYDTGKVGYVCDFLLTLIKHQNHCYTFALDLGEGERQFAFGRIEHFAAGSEIMSPRQESGLRMLAFERWLVNVVPLLTVLTGLQPPPLGDASRYPAPRSKYENSLFPGNDHPKLLSSECAQAEAAPLEEEAVGGGPAEA
jgi:hypothetical protein